VENVPRYERRITTSEPENTLGEIRDWEDRAEKIAALAKGSDRLAEFSQAPAQLQAEFWRQLDQAGQRRRGLELWLAETADEQPLPTPPELRDQRPVVWDASWQRRARALRRAQLEPEEDWTPDRHADPLLDLQAVDYVPALTGERPEYGSRICCPLPDHDDHTFDFNIYDDGWYCFGCNRGGGIYQLAAPLWGIEPRGRGFREIHVRLRGLFR
jgi:hypothetical protein